MRLSIVAISAYPDIVPKARTTIGGLETNRYPLPSSGYHLWCFDSNCVSRGITKGITTQNRLQMFIQ